MWHKITKRTAKLIWAISFIGITCLVVLYLYNTGFFQAVRSMDDMRAYIEHFSAYSYAIFFIVQLTSVVIAPIPSNVTALAGGALFGTIPAFLLTYAAVVVGAIIVFQLARILGQPFVERFVSRRDMEKYMDIVQRKETIFFVMTFLLPGFPDDILCFLAGLTPIRLRRFIIIVMVCRPWGLLLSCVLGGNTLALPVWAWVLLGGAAIALFVIAMKYGDRWEASLLEKFKNR